MIEIKKNESSGEFELAVDNVTASKDEATIIVDLANEWRQFFSVDIHDSRLQQKVITHRFSELPNSLLVLKLNFDRDCITTSLKKMIDIRPNDMRKAYAVGSKQTEHILSFEFTIDLENWRHPWSVAEYIDECKRIFTQHSTLGFMWRDWGQYTSRRGFALSVSNLSKEDTLKSELSKHTETICKLFGLTEVSLMSGVHTNSVVTHFDFPEEVRVPCEQYLLYFVQFLKDLGVEATADLQHQAGQVLFAVTPTDKETALDKIRTALETYLQLPSNPVSDGSIAEYEVAEQRLAANIDHLKGQLRLAHAELRLAEATVQTQQVMINHLLNGQVIIDSMKAVTPKPKEEDKEELLDGTVALTKVNWKGVEFNLPEIFRRLRGLFREDQ